MMFSDLSTPVSASNIRNVDTVENKRDKFRQEIRRNSISNKFGEIRKRLVNDLHSDVLRGLVKSLENQGFNQQNLKKMVSILDDNTNQADFSIKFSQEKLQLVIIDLLQKHAKGLNIEEKCRLMSALNNFTYFSNNSLFEITSREDFMDFLRREMQNLEMDRLQNLCYFESIVVLLINLSSLLRQDFNLYLAESDMALRINCQIAKTSVICQQTSDEFYIETVYTIREQILRLYKNIAYKMSGSADVTAKLLEQVLLDEVYLTNHKMRVFFLLAQAMNKENFWAYLLERRDSRSLVVKLTETMDFLQQRCLSESFLQDKNNTLSEKEYNQFYAMICFLNELFYEDVFLEFDWLTVIEQTFNGYMLAEFMFESVRERRKDEIQAALRMFAHLSRGEEITAQQLIVTRDADDPLELIKVFTFDELTKGFTTGPYCFEILTNLLRKNPNHLNHIMEYRIADSLQEIISNKDNPPKLICEAINLIHELIEADMRINNEAKVIIMLENRKIIEKIDHMVGHNNREVYKRAELFTEFISNKRQ